MDRVIIKKKAENITPIYPEVSDEEINPHTKEMFPRFKKKKKKIRPEPGGVHEQLLDGMGDERNKFKGMGTDVGFGYDADSTVPGW